LTEDGAVELSLMLCVYLLLTQVHLSSEVGAGIGVLTFALRSHNGGALTKVIVSMSKDVLPFRWSLGAGYRQEPASSSLPM
jgi:hypothetical protein